jgi:uncharacterized membrane protein YccC
VKPLWRKLGFGFFAGAVVLFFNTDFNPWFPTHGPRVHGFAETLAALVGAGLLGAVVMLVISLWQSRRKP